MTIVALIIFAFFSLQFIVAVSNLMFREQMKDEQENEEILVSILVPARNEENNIGNLIESVLNQKHSNFELIIFDDQSDDRTAALVMQYKQKDARIQLIPNKQLPEGWLGKNYACYSLARHAKGDYLLFLDADVKIKGSIISKSINYTRKHALTLLSVFPKQIMLSSDEKKTVPVMNYILLSLLPLRLVRISKFASLAAANGQFMFFSATEYHQTQAHEKMKMNKVEDIAIARFLKKKGYKVSCQTGYDEITCRMYSNYAEAVNGFSRNINDYFGGSVFVSLLFWLITSFGIFILFWKLNIWLAITGLIVFILTRVFVAVISKQSVAENLRYLIQQQWAMGVFIITSIKNRFKKEHEWKGRSIGW